MRGEKERKKTMSDLIKKADEIICMPLMSKYMIESSAEEIASQILEESNGEKELVLITAVKMYFDVIEKILRNNIFISESYSIAGVKLECGTSARQYNFSEDKVYAALDEKLKARKKILMTKVSHPDLEIKDGDDVVPLVTQKSGGGATVKLTFPK